MHHLTRTTWRLYFIGGLLLVIGLIALPQLSHAGTPATERVSVGTDGAQGNAESGSGSSRGAAISADGRFIAFQSATTNLVPGDNNASADIFLRDRQTATTTRVSLGVAGAEADGRSVAPSISSDGRYIAFGSDATNLIADDTNFATDVFVHDRQSGATARVSVDSAGVPGNANSSCASISADGQVVSFTSFASNLVVGDTNASHDVFAHNSLTGVTERVSVNGAGVQGDGMSACPSISADGTIVAFASAAANLVPDDTNGAPDVFAHHRPSGAIIRVSVNSAGNQGAGDMLLGDGVSVSADGRYVAFDSFDNSLVPGDTASQDVFVHDRQTGATTRVSVDSQGGQGSPSDVYKFGPAISGDGRHVAFASFAALVADDTNSTTDVYVHDLQSGITRRVSMSHAGDQGNGDSRYPAISADGHFAVFSSEASNLVTADTNTCLFNHPSCRDVFVRDLEALPATPTPRPTAFGDVDCDEDVDAVDALKVLRHVAGLPVSQTEPCPDIGPPPTVAPTNTVPAPSGPAITVNELQIQFTVPSSLSDLTQVRRDGGSQAAVNFSTATLGALGPYCDAAHAALGTLRVGGPQAFLDEVVASFPHGNLYYNRPQGPCVDDKAAMDLQGQQISEFSAALETVVYVGP